MSWQVFAQSQPLTIVTGLDKPPYSLNKATAGFELELLTQVFKQIDIEVEFLSAPFGRTSRMLHLDYVDGITTSNAISIDEAKYLTDIYIHYQNVAISRAQDNLELSSIEDLAKHSIVAFQRANTLLGERFTRASEASPLYFEVARQDRQIALLRQKKVDTLVMDINIFTHFNQTTQVDARIHPVFPLSPYRLALQDTKLVERFNQALEFFLASEDYFDLADKWQIDKRLLVVPSTKR